MFDVVDEKAMQAKCSIRISVVGTLRVETAEGVDITPRSAKARALIGILALTSDYRRARRWIEAKLWSDRSPLQASGSLRQALSELRRAFGDAACVLNSSREEVWFDVGAVFVDIRHAKEDAFAIGASGRELFEGLTVRDNEFEEWARMERLRYENKSTTSMDHINATEQIELRPGTLTLHASFKNDENAKRVARACAEMVRRLLDIEVEVLFTG